MFILYLYEHDCISFFIKVSFDTSNEGRQCLRADAQVGGGSGGILWKFSSKVFFFFFPKPTDLTARGIDK